MLWSFPGVSQFTLVMMKMEAGVKIYRVFLIELGHYDVNSNAEQCPVIQNKSF